MRATHVANPVHVEARQIVKVETVERPLDRFNLTAVLLDNGVKTELSAGMVARHHPVPGDYLVTQEDGYQYINPREVFERKYRPIGNQEPVQFDQSDIEVAEFLCRVASSVVDSKGGADLCTVVVGALGGKVTCHTRNSTLDSIATLRMGEKIMLDVAMPNPTVSGDAP